MDKGLALIDIVRAIHADLIQFQLPPATFARLLEAMADLEYRLNHAVVEKIQLGSFVRDHCDVSYYLIKDS